MTNSLVKKPVLFKAAYKTEILGSQKQLLADSAIVALLSISETFLLHKLSSISHYPIVE